MKYLKINANLLDTHILRLRFGNYSKNLPTFSLHSYKTIAWLLKTSIGRVKRVCSQFFKDFQERKENYLNYFRRKSQQFIQKKPKLKDFSETEREWLTSQETLTRFVSLTMNERAAEFNHKFKTDKANSYFVRKIYRIYQVKQKMIHDTKILTPEQGVRQRNQIFQLKIDLQAMLLDGYKIVCVDEMMCTVGTVPKRCWSPKLKPMKIDKKWINSQTIACCAAISEDGGVDHVGYYKRSLDRWDFAKFLTELREKLGEEKVCIFMDQLAVHKSHHVRDTMEILKFKFLLNAAYFPDGNGIEYTFSQVKHKFKKLRLTSILNGKRDRAKVQLKKAFGEIKIIDCKKNIQRSFQNINNFQ